MEFNLTTLIILLVVSFGVMVSDASTSSLSPEMYWRKTFPNTPIPKAIKDFLDPTGSSLLAHRKSRDPKLTGCVQQNEFTYAVTQEQVDKYKQKYGQRFLLKKDMKPGTKITMQWSPPTTSSADRITFLPQEVADSIPFSSKKLPEIFTRLSIDPKSEAAEMMEETLRRCEQKDRSNGAEQKHCSTSLKSMVSFSTSKLGSSDVRVTASTTKVVDGKEISLSEGKVEFAIVGVKKEVGYGSPEVACHRQPYPYAVFYCHKIRMTAAYTVSLVGGGMAVEAPAVCHGDTSWWNPKTMALQLLEVKPGTTTPVCHFLEEGNLLWTKK